MERLSFSLTSRTFLEMSSQSQFQCVCDLWICKGDLLGISDKCYQSWLPAGWPQTWAITWHSPRRRRRRRADTWRVIRLRWQTMRKSVGEVCEQHARATAQVNAAWQKTDNMASVCIMSWWYSKQPLEWFLAFLSIQWTLSVPVMTPS